MIKHNRTQDLLLYWMRLKGKRAVPDREDIRPRDIKVLLPNIFILEQVDDDHLIFRLAGTDLCRHYGREFRDHNFLSLWPAQDLPHLRDLLNQVINEGQPGLMYCRARTLDHTTLTAEVIFLPFRDKRSNSMRILGAGFALKGTRALMAKKLVRQHVLQLMTLGYANDNENIIPFSREANKA